MNTFELAKKAISLIDATDIRIQMYASEPVSHTIATFEDSRDLVLSKEEALYAVQRHLKKDKEIQSLLNGQDIFEDVHPQAFNARKRIKELKIELTEYLPEDYSYDFDHTVWYVYLDAWADFIRGILRGDISEEKLEVYNSYFEEYAFDDEFTLFEYVDD